ncbi:hypothetical protein [Planctomicrobium piriforme]|uniref:Uncharacterized protein n=1 Tax=Planctomicrobium piriforme TaxID=1576369 RepID=A0A1I3KVG7_9PLAN|nr:hypothetical protein [Planctomicrobium piriforme]SFI76493.1 hypothetical protein SAMN05421753_11257 [Planctomicrobium piriforme]
MAATETTTSACVDQIDERDDVYQPTPEEIREACQAIQSEWTEAERARRARGQAGRQRAVVVTNRRFAKILLDKSIWDGRAA